MFAVILTLNTVIPYFHWTLWLMMIYQQTKFGSEDVAYVYFDYSNYECILIIQSLTHHSDPLEAKDSTPTF